MRIAIGGDVGFGTTTPDDILDIVTADPILIVRDTDTGASTSNARLRLAESGASDTLDLYWDVKADNTDSNFDFHIAEGTTSRLTIDRVTGNVGIGDTTVTEATLVVGNAGAGNIFLTLDTAGTTNNAVCWDNLGATLLYDCDSTPVDYAESFPVAQGVTFGDIVMTSEKMVTSATGAKVPRLVKATEGGNKKIIGVTSDNYHDFTSAGMEEINPSDNPLPVALNGRVPTKVTTVNGPINIGDPITASQIPGVGKKSTKPERVVGLALEKYSNPDPNAVGEIVVFINPHFGDPDVYLTDSGTLNISAPDANYNFTVSKNGQIVDRIGAFKEVVSAKIRTGLIDASQITSISLTSLSANIGSLTTNTAVFATDSITIAGENIRDFITGIVDERLAFQGLALEGYGIVSPLQTDGDNIVASLPAPDSSFIIRNSSQSAVASVDGQGNLSLLGSLIAKQLEVGSASISGKLSSKELEVSSDATISGTLRAKKIIAEDIEGLNITSSTVSANYITNNITNIYNSTASSAATNEQPLTTNSSQSGVSSQQLAVGSSSAVLNSLYAMTGTFQQGLMSFGPTSFFEASVADRLFVGSSLSLADNSINVLGSNLEIQPLRQGGVSFLSGLVEIDWEGNLRVEGNALFAKDVKVKGKLSANVIAPIPGKDLIFEFPELNPNNPSTGIKFRTGTGSATLSINNKGDLTASGAGTFAKLNLNFVGEAQALSPTEVIATGSAGTAFVRANQNELTVISPLISENSLIYITPIGQTGGRSLYLLRQTAEDEKLNGTEGSFTVGISSPAQQDTKFNFLIIN
ncbi:MAG: hypothetical protein HY431_02365 [Candidatus Levybacteria bacterium]|nr:hypothetical protein [Candidatus Levybacteria bacterium]